MTQKVTVGRIVNFVVAEGIIRPMIVTNVNEGGTINGVQFRDGSNDDQHDHCVTPKQTQAWRTSVSYDAKASVNSWHWPKVPAATATPAKAQTVKAAAKAPAKKASTAKPAAKKSKAA